MSTTFASRAADVFDAGLPTIDYEQLQEPTAAHAIFKAARAQAPVALGPHGPELLTYELVHSVLRDPRSTSRPASCSPPKASRRVRCGTGWPPIC